MKVIMVMFDSLNKRMLPPYGCDWIHAPNFLRLAEKAVTFDCAYAGSLPCMPARRELHTGRYNFLHRNWGPLEPYDDSMPEILRGAGVYTHLISDHFHYWEDGGATYHSRYNTWEIVRGQAGDPWIGNVADPEIPEFLGSRTKESMPAWRQDWINRKHMGTEEEQPQTQTFDKALQFIETNKKEDKWFLHIETFDPHEPFFTQQKYKDLYSHEYGGPHFDWPEYTPVKEPPEAVEHCRKEYAALVSMCDQNLGRILDKMDRENMWEDTMLIVNADHGFLLGEHDRWAKKVSPFYNEVAAIPLFIHDPRFPSAGHRKSLVQTIDVAPTILDLYGIAPTEDMEGKPLQPVMERDEKIRDAALFGHHGMHVNCTDGRYVYMRAPNPSNAPLNHYTLVPLHMMKRFSTEELHSAELVEPFSFTKGCKILKTKAGAVLPQKSFLKPDPYETMLFDLESDPEQKRPLDNPEVEGAMIEKMVGLMRQNDAPPEQYKRLGLE